MYVLKHVWENVSIIPLEEIEKKNKNIISYLFIFQAFYSIACTIKVDQKIFIFPA